MKKITLIELVKILKKFKYTEIEEKQVDPKYIRKIFDILHTKKQDVTKIKKWIYSKNRFFNRQKAMNFLNEQVKKYNYYHTNLKRSFPFWKVSFAEEEIIGEKFWIGKDMYLLIKNDKQYIYYIDHQCARSWKDFFLISDLQFLKKIKEYLYKHLHETKKKLMHNALIDNINNTLKHLNHI